MILRPQSYFSISLARWAGKCWKKFRADAINKNGKLLRLVGNTRNPILPVYHASAWRKTRTWNCGFRESSWAWQEREFAFVPKSWTRMETELSICRWCNKIDGIASRKIKSARVSTIGPKIIGSPEGGEGSVATGEPITRTISLKPVAHLLQ